MILLTPLLIARHWPFLDGQLVLGRWKNGRGALELLATLQVEAGGEPVNWAEKGSFRCARERGRRARSGEPWRSSSAAT